MMDDDDPTGAYMSDAWSEIDARSEDFVRLQSDYDVLSVATDEDDIISLASSSTHHSSRSVMSTAVYGDHLLSTETALTNCGPVPLSSLPPSFFAHRLPSEDGDAASLRSVNTRRGWPRVAPGHPPMASELVQQHGSYRDAVLRRPTPAQQESASPSDDGPSHNRPSPVPRQPMLRHGVGAPSAQAALVGGRIVLTDRGLASGWVSLSARGGRKTRQLLHRGARLASLTEEDAEENGGVDASTLHEDAEEENVL